MAWNSENNKDLRNSAEKAMSNPGAPIAFDMGRVGKPYKDGWDIDRAYREGMQKVTWVFRCIDAIAGNQARLPVILRKGNDQRGEQTKDNKSLLEIFNSKSNDGENSFAFRYRVSAQLLMSTRGVFIEKVRSRDGKIIALQLLPPQYTAPIPDSKKFVQGFEVDMRNGTKFVLKPEDVCWIRRPHPLDPYLSMTPMESAGIAIELENLSKLYNRNYLINDGRPGGLLVVRGDMEDDDKQELKNRFRGNISRTGSTTVIASESGVDYVDTSASPRDAAYTQMREIQKNEIFAAFGVPESVIGNASGRTFSNASEELRVFWMETMAPHLHTLARALDELDDKYYVDFDTEDIPILILAKQERERYVMDEFQQGLISLNEYRTATGRKKVDSELADSLLSNPNLTPIANTEKPFKPEEQQPVDMAGVDPNAAPPGLPPQEGAMEMPVPAPPAPVPAPDMPAQATETASLTPDQQLSEFEKIQHEMQLKFVQELETKADTDTERWTEILDRALERIFERQQRVVLEKAFGKRGVKSISSGVLTVDMIFDREIWDKQLAEDLEPIILAIYTDAKEYVASRTSSNVVMEPQEVEKLAQQQIERMQQANSTTAEEIASAIAVALMEEDEEERSVLLRLALIAIFLKLISKRRRDIAEHEAQASYNGGVYLAGKDNNVGQTKTWITRKDSRVRNAHKFLEGKTVNFGDGFVVDGLALRFPGDPLAPPALTFNCRCRLRFGFSN
ncbi:Phage portal protein, HK97 [uncultured Caudovirales phage]|uniref:Phage portal protein, HK97 n=1 Tax=uncultured Caudovirales phage TaxID=2100421 RepID=A0A6J5S0X0_9CAUD|nr:Phage portal protein, HK97 [uncultured Caudovirales phage]CAB4155947.1 Phage portal protein, HK97 [uncultured Caudovirales phage]CAB4160265.1 Phage portal protein, HK97 [uncultured Caudovirales phage]CAB4164690.1 Phage portal protein, HK97 [uncultured Caudovirales phage]CAB4171915.1 Phage portal protein, HK97 [uncultured Caudovirales phage]